MSFPNPANYFLPMPEPLQKEIEILIKGDLRCLIADVAHYLANDSDQFIGSRCSPEFDDFVTPLKEEGLIQLIKYLAERLLWLKSQDEPSHAQP
jgi:hypothetical protein